MNKPNQDSSAWEAERDAEIETQFGHTCDNCTDLDGRITKTKKLVARNFADFGRLYSYTQDPAIQGLVRALENNVPFTHRGDCGVHVPPGVSWSGKCNCGLKSMADALSTFAAARARVEGGE